ncbi:hypothetical protein BDP55DRAFT_423626 [Colletotrichum godetiae]|uniref:Secreted protein n=1 Tax=Colletotrichum godetiae TaxID=1209918 RepID=A0AAJ0A9R6_9PEZI|nr:uncharacterized protein BDP55DRAFT_423626 [Colletotrichum godetiae]KAK1657622.1 hypothetical protein BDP55DRAFT_423626 [Colletotrichum godetiae]
MLGYLIKLVFSSLVFVPPAHHVSLLASTAAMQLRSLAYPVPLICLVFSSEAYEDTPASSNSCRPDLYSEDHRLFSPTRVRVWISFTHSIVGIALPTQTFTPLASQTPSPSALFIAEHPFACGRLILP